MRVGAKAGIAALLTAAVLIGGGFAIGSLRGGDDNIQTANAPKPLPAVSQKPIKPRVGQTRAGAVYANASPAVVSVRSSDGSGTAFLVGADGTLVSNAHVVAGDQRVVVRFGREGESLDATVLGTDTSIDLAVLKIDATAIPPGVKPLKFADSTKVAVGDVAIAIGNPFGLERSATEGIVSALGRDIQAPNGFSIDEVIQTDAPINPGNSGGPLLNDSGLVIGVTTQIATSGNSQGNVGIGFAVPSNTVRQAVPILKQGQAIKRSYLGVETSPTLPGDPQGAEVRTVRSGGPAESAGIQIGDVITKLDGAEITDPTRLSTEVGRHRPGDRVRVTVDRDGATKTIDATLGVRPSSSG
jgi:putative serine protease PepD